MMRSVLTFALSLIFACGHARAQDETGAALAECDRAAASDIDPERPTSVSGVLLRAVDPQAVSVCEAAVKAAPGNRRLIFQLGRAYEAAKEYEKARAQYARSDEL